VAGCAVGHHLAKKQQQQRQNQQAPKAVPPTPAPGAATLAS
jgi:hypothetical protein